MCPMSLLCQKAESLLQALQLCACWHCPMLVARRPFVKQSPAPHGCWLPYKVQSHCQLETAAGASTPPAPSVPAHICCLQLRSLPKTHSCPLTASPTTSLTPGHAIPQLAAGYLIPLGLGGAGGASADRSQCAHGACSSAEGAAALRRAGCRPRPHSCPGQLPRQDNLLPVMW